MNCPSCNKPMKRVPVSIEDMKQKAISWQCPTCGRFSFGHKKRRYSLTDNRKV